MTVPPTFCLLVGLGNPGPAYAQNRHNIGFMAADAWSGRQAATGRASQKWQSEVTLIERATQKIAVIKPQTYMNRSGSAVQAAASFYKISPDRIIVLHDELDFEFGRLAIKTGGGHGGHNGLRDIIATLGSPQFIRLRLGIGRPLHGEPTAWVLANFAKDELAARDELIMAAADAVDSILEHGLAEAMNRHNRDLLAKSSD